MSPTPNTASRNVLSTDVEIKGNLRFAGELTFAGKLDGEIHSEGALHLSDEAVVRGNMNLHTAILRGKINGNVSAKDKIEIKSKGELFGDIRAPKLIIEEGATFVGKCEVNPNKSSPLPLPGAPGATKLPEPVIPAKK
ncbi:MAG TPA: polymer-forming cytoskeletal protein [Verrucomicrobiae bacterium]|jgi:cytoskeletal protein CcmA (bactofilin family)|nr:polymer-forming cytoskeletal protein [Verrucomicrobiae bacterium]